jgi:hypothetical protein
MVYIVMDYIVMAYIVMAYIVMAYVTMAYAIMTCIIMAYIIMAYIVMAYIVTDYIVMAYIVMAYTVMAYIVMAYTVMAYIVMAYTVMAYIAEWLRLSGSAQMSFVSSMVGGVWSLDLAIGPREGFLLYLDFALAQVPAQYVPVCCILYPVCYILYATSRVLLGALDQPLRHRRPAAATASDVFERRDRAANAPLSPTTMPHRWLACLVLAKVVVA